MAGPRSSQGLTCRHILPSYPRSLCCAGTAREAPVKGPLSNWKKRVVGRAGSGTSWDRGGSPGGPGVSSSLCGGRSVRGVKGECELPCSPQGVRGALVAGLPASTAGGLVSARCRGARGCGMPAVRILLPGLVSLKPLPEVLLGVCVCTCKALNTLHPVFWDSGCGLHCVPRGHVQSSHPLLVHVTLFGGRVFAVVRIRVDLL